MSRLPVPPGDLAVVLSFLEMRAPPKPRPLPGSPLRLVRWAAPSPDRYRALFRRVGEPWLWFSRLVMEDAALAAILADRLVQVYAVTDPRGIEVGLLELDFRAAGECDLAFFGLVPELTGKGHGRWLMGQALTRAWAPGIERVRVYTCTLDHPSALGFYRAQGFTVYDRMIETFPDPRLLGVLPRDAAPRIPLLQSTPIR